MGSLFGGNKSKSEQSSETLSGFNALPGDLQNRFRDLYANYDTILGNPSQYFAPMGLTNEELSARDLITSYQRPGEFQANIEQFLNPYRNILTEDINRAFEDPYSAYKSRASEAGAFGSSRMREGEADLERERFNAIQRGLAEQYGEALNQQQATIGNLLGFGGLERSVDFAQRQAPIAALSQYAGLLNPLLNAGKSTSTSVNTQKSGSGLGGLASAFGAIGGGLGGLGMAFPGMFGGGGALAFSPSSNLLYGGYGL